MMKILKKIVRRIGHSVLSRYYRMPGIPRDVDPCVPQSPARTDRLIGILMIRNENDVLEETLQNITQFYDRIFVLDGTEPESELRVSEAILRSFPEVTFIMRDADTDGPFPIRDGARHYLLEEVRRQYGVGNWIGVLHGDEFYSRDPRPFIALLDPAKVPIIQARLCHFFLHTDDKATWEERKDKPVQDRITHYMWPGTPENRLFYDDGRCRYDPRRHKMIVPYGAGARRMRFDHLVIKQYNYRTPEQMHERAAQRLDSDWQVHHYGHIRDSDMYFVPSLHIPGCEPCGWDNRLIFNSDNLSKPRSTRDYPLPIVSGA